MNRKIGVQLILFISLFLFISVTLSSTVYCIPPITQETIIVDISGNGDYTSIKDAINNADITDIILIKKGTYDESDLTIKKKIGITGEDPSNTIINCSGNIAFTLSSSYVDISNLQIINTGEFAISILPGSTGCTITNCIINTYNTGVALNIRSSYNTVSDCNLIGIDNSKQGVKITGNYNFVKNCDMQDFANGVLLITNSDNNQIQNCNIFNCENAIDIRFDSNNNILTRNNIYSNLQTIKIWLNSNNNFVYLNNFWKNDN
ncbi:MAG: right-handed parallel beta-helix repeat-containing protein, partial [Thermoplasmatales archaeon]